MTFKGFQGPAPGGQSPAAVKLRPIAEMICVPDRGSGAGGIQCLRRVRVELQAYAGNQIL